MEYDDADVNEKHAFCRKDYEICIQPFLGRLLKL
jgi:hypothetical protein